MRLSTHVLDTAAGCPAAGVRVELFRIEGADRTQLADTATNADGRTDAPLLADGQPGLYELVFHVGAHFAATGTPTFLDTVPLRFRAEAGHYHVPLLVTPWSYATYRGS